MEIQRYYSPELLPDANGKVMLHADHLAALAAQQEEVDREEKSHLQTIDERDRAEEALSQAYYLVVGHSPEWSNLFGHDEAINDIDDAQKCLRAEVAAQQEEIDRVKADLDAEVLRLQRARIGDAEIIGRWQCEAEGAQEKCARSEQAIAALEATVSFSEAEAVLDLPMAMEKFIEYVDFANKVLVRRLTINRELAACAKTEATG